MNALFVQSALGIIAMQGLPFSCLCAGLFPIAVLLEAQMLFAFIGPVLFQ